MPDFMMSTEPVYTAQWHYGRGFHIPYTWKTRALQSSRNAYIRSIHVLHKFWFNLQHSKQKVSTLLPETLQIISRP